MKAGTPYYINVPGTLSKSVKKYFKGVFETGVNELKLTDVNFEEGKVFDITDTRCGQLNLSFNMNAKADDTNIKIGVLIAVTTLEDPLQLGDVKLVGIARIWLLPVMRN